MYFISIDFSVFCILVTIFACIYDEGAGHESAGTVGGEGGRRRNCRNADIQRMHTTLSVTECSSTPLAKHHQCITLFEHRCSPGLAVDTLVLTCCEVPEGVAFS